jgi:hypothetical protein
MKIVNPTYIPQSAFASDLSNEDTLSVLEKCLDPSISSLETITSCLDLINNTIRYAKKKIRKLTNNENTLKFPLEDEKAIYDIWYNTYSTSIIRCLAPGQEITEALVDDYLKGLEFHKSIVCVNSQLYKFLKDWYSGQLLQPDRYVSILLASGLSSLTDHEYVLVPIKEKSWSLVGIDNVNKVFEFYTSDSFMNFAGPCETIEKALKELEQTEAYDWEVMESPEETSKFDSGVFMLLMLKAISNNEPFDFKPEDIEYYRFMLAVELHKTR